MFLSGLVLELSLLSVLAKFVIKSLPEQNMELVSDQLYKYTYVFQTPGEYHTRETCKFDSVFTDDGSTFLAAYEAGYSITPSIWQTISGWFTTLGESIGVLPDPSVLVNSTHIYDTPVNISIPDVVVLSGDNARIVATLKRGDTLVSDAACEVDIVDLADNDAEVDYRSAFNAGDGTYVYNWNNTGGHATNETFEVIFNCSEGIYLNLRHIEGTGLVKVNLR